MMTSVVKIRPFKCYPELIDRRYDLIENGLNIEYFHASSDRQEVRNQVFDGIAMHLKNLRIDSVIVEKSKVGPALRPVEKFYPKMLGYLLRYVISKIGLRDTSELIVVTDQIPIKKSREAIIKAVRKVLTEMLPEGVNYRILHHDSKSNVGLQIADYCNWAIYRKWAREDERSYRLISEAIKSEFDIFRLGRRNYY